MSGVLWATNTLQTAVVFFSSCLDLSGSRALGPHLIHVPVDTKTANNVLYNQVVNR
jgi:hypothetical protein